MSPAADAPARWWRWRGAALELDLRVQPKASRDQFAGPHGERYRVTISAPPVDGKANKYLCRYLAKAFGVPPSRVSLVSGQTGRDKRVHIESPQRIPTELADLIDR